MEVQGTARPYLIYNELRNRFQEKCQYVVIMTLSLSPSRSLPLTIVVLKRTISDCTINCSQTAPNSASTTLVSHQIPAAHPQQHIQCIQGWQQDAECSCNSLLIDLFSYISCTSVQIHLHKVQMKVRVRVFLPVSITEASPNWLPARMSSCFKRPAVPQWNTVDLFVFASSQFLGSWVSKMSDPVGCIGLVSRLSARLDWSVIVYQRSETHERATIHRILVTSH